MDSLQKTLGSPLNPNPSPRFPPPPPDQPYQDTKDPTSAATLLWCGLGPSLPASVVPCRFWYACSVVVICGVCGVMCFLSFGSLGVVMTPLSPLLPFGVRSHYCLLRPVVVVSCRNPVWSAPVFSSVLCVPAPCCIDPGHVDASCCLVCSALFCIFYSRFSHAFGPSCMLLGIRHWLPVLPLSPPLL